MSVYHPESTLTKCFSDESSSIPTGFHVSKLQRVKETKQQQQTSNKNQTKQKKNKKKVNIVALELGINIRIKLMNLHMRNSCFEDF